MSNQPLGPLGYGWWCMNCEEFLTTKIMNTICYTERGHDVRAAVVLEDLTHIEPDDHDVVHEDERTDAAQIRCACGAAWGSQPATTTKEDRTMTSITKAPGHAQVRCEVCLVHDQDGGLRPVSYSTPERPNGRIGVCEVCELFIAKGRITLTKETLQVIRHIRARQLWMVHIRHGAGVSPCSAPRCGNGWHYHAGGGNPQLNGRPWKVCSTEGCDHVYAIESEHRLKLPGDVCWDCHQRR